MREKGRAYFSKDKHIREMPQSTDQTRVWRSREQGPFDTLCASCARLRSFITVIREKEFGVF
jgi:hypothetical protein